MEFRFRFCFAHCEFPYFVGFIIILTLTTVAINGTEYNFDSSTCRLSVSLKNEIHSYLPIVEEMRKAIEGPLRNKTYNDMDDFIDKVGPRVSGSKGMERAVEYLAEKLIQPGTGLKFVKKEKVEVPKPITGTAYAELILPRKLLLPILPERFPSNTPPHGILSKAIIVNSMRQLKSQRQQISGNILVINIPGKSGQGYTERKEIYRLAIFDGYNSGAVAILIRSLNTLSLYTLVDQMYANPPLPIPIATTTVEDADLLSRMAARGENIVIRISILGYSMGNATSYNLISDYEGSSLPNEYVIVSGHMDNVKIGLGVTDDAVGLFLSLNTIRLYHHLKLRPKRTTRLVFWTSEEYEFIGSKQFVKTHATDLQAGRYRAALEADNGCDGFPGIIGSIKPPEFLCILNEILISMFKGQPNVENVVAETFPTDVYVMYNNSGVPYAILSSKLDGKYLWYHHTAGDTMSAIYPNEVDTCLLVYSAVAFILSDLDSLPTF